MSRRRTVVLPLLLAALVACSGVVRAALYDAVLTEYSGNTVQKSNTVLETSANDTSGACAKNDNSVIILSNVNITTSGQTSSEDSSSFNGLNAGVLAAMGGKVVMYNVIVHTKGSGGNGVFGYNGTIEIYNSTIYCDDILGHGVDTTYGGYAYVENVDIVTLGAHGAPLSNDRGGGTIVCKGGVMSAQGQGSPGIYSTGTINVTGAHITAHNTEAATIEGRNSITLVDTYISGVCQGVKIYCSVSGDAEFGHATFSMTGGTLNLTSESNMCLSNSNSMFYIDGTNDQEATINLDGVQFASVYSNFMIVENSAVVDLKASSQTFSGAITSTSSTTSVSLATSSAYSGAITSAAMTLDSSSSWKVTGASTLTSLNTSGKITPSKSSSTITVSGTATLSGTLSIPSTFASGTYTILTASSISGKFTSITSPSTELTATASYTSTAVTVTVVNSGSTTTDSETTKTSSNAATSSTAGKESSMASASQTAWVVLLAQLLAVVAAQL